MGVIWTKYLLPQALKSCPSCNKSPNLVTLDATVLMPNAYRTLNLKTKKLFGDEVNDL